MNILILITTYNSPDVLLLLLRCRSHVLQPHARYYLFPPLVNGRCLISALIKAANHSYDGPAARSWHRWAQPRLLWIVEPQRHCRQECPPPGHSSRRRGALPPRQKNRRRTAGKRPLTFSSQAVCTVSGTSGYLCRSEPGPNQVFTSHLPWTCGLLVLAFSTAKARAAASVSRLWCCLWCFWPGVGGCCGRWLSAR